jgi:predicted PurR-regulated permease PerM
MIIDTRRLAEWLVCATILLGLLVIGRPLLVPFAFALLVWAVLNALTDALHHRFRLPQPVAWSSSLVLIVGSIYIVARIFADETAAIAGAFPVYIAKLNHFADVWLRFLRLGPLPSLRDLLSASGLAGILGQAAASAGDLLFQFLLIAIYVAFLLAEQRFLEDKLGKLETDALKRDETGNVIRAIARQLQTYMGVCTFLSVGMGLFTYVVLWLLGVNFAEFWALVLFIANYIPTVGGAVVVLPALMVLVQTGSLGQTLVVFALLEAMHFVLANVVSTIMLGRTLNMSPLAIIVSLSFWGLIWGIAGLFLAVPLTSALILVSEQIEGLHWFAVAMAGPDPRQRKRKPTRHFSSAA